MRNEKTVRIVSLERRHIDAIVAVHMRAFPEFFLSFLGPRFLREFYAAFLVDAGAFGFIAEDGANLAVGGVVGTVTPAGFFRRLLKRRWWAFILASCGSVVRRPRILPRLAQALWYRGEAPGGCERALLSSIAVDPEKQGRGVGKLLVQRFLEEVRKRGSSGCYLTTDADNNDSVNSFYRNAGWKIESAYKTPEGRRMNRYVFDYDQAPAKDPKPFQ